LAAAAAQFRAAADRDQRPPAPARPGRGPRARRAAGPRGPDVRRPRLDAPARHAGLHLVGDGLLPLPDRDVRDLPDRLADRPGADGVTSGTNLFTSAFFTVTGFHGLHVLIGLVMLAAVLVLARGGDYAGGRRHGAVASVAAYWHFVDAVWVVVFSVVYLWAL